MLRDLRVVRRRRTRRRASARQCVIDVKQQKVYVYRPGQAPEEVDGPGSLSGHPVLANFLMRFERVWAAGF